MEEERNDGYYLEAMDRLHVVTCTIYDHILSHPAMIKCGVEKDVKIACELLQNAYQAIGRHEFENELHKEV